MQPDREKDQKQFWPKTDKNKMNEYHVPAGFCKPAQPDRRQSRKISVVFRAAHTRRHLLKPGFAASQKTGLKTPTRLKG